MTRWNYRPAQRPVFIDIETQSIRDIGPGYLRDPSTRMMSFVADNVTWRLGEPWPTMPTYRTVFAAHNAEGFDAEAWGRFTGHTPEWFDTAHLCRQNGLPGGLDRACKMLGIPGKQEDGKRLMLLLTKGKPARKDDLFPYVYPYISPSSWEKLMAYNVQDVVAMTALYDKLAPAQEPDVIEAHCEINERGILADIDYFQRLKGRWGEVQGLACQYVTQLTGGELTADNLRSVPQVRKWLSKQGFDTASLNRQTLEDFYEDPESFFEDSEDGEKIVKVLKCRQAVCRSGVAKIERVFEHADPDGRCRKQTVYCGSNLGRWSGRGIQLHNMQRGGTEYSLEQLDTNRPLSELFGSKASLDDVLATLFRPGFRAAAGRYLAILDYAQVEARCLAWMADEQELLSAYRNGTDTYVEMAKKIGPNATRQIGKVTVLGCGYGMSAKRFAHYCPEANAEECVGAYRKSFPKIVKLWKQAQKALLLAIDGKPQEIARCRLEQVQGNLVVTLPSGRRITYRNAHIEDRVPGYAKYMSVALDKRPTTVYDHPHGNEKVLYGGLFVENLDQAMCRDLLAEAMVRLRPWVVLHVHDELILEINHPLEMASFARIMADPPAWARGLPIAVEGCVSERYCKSKDMVKVTA